MCDAIWTTFNKIANNRDTNKNSWCKFMEKDEYLLNLFSGKISNFQVMWRSTISDKYKGTGGV